MRQESRISSIGQWDFDANRNSDCLKNVLLGKHSNELKRKGRDFGLRDNDPYDKWFLENEK